MKTVKLEVIVRQKDPELEQIASTSSHAAKCARRYRILTRRAASIRFEATLRAPLRGEQS